MGAAGRAPATAGRPVDARRPVGVEEPLQVPPVGVAVQDHRRALGRVAVLVDVGRDLGDARDPEVPRRHRPAEVLEERQHEAADAAVDVAADAPLGGQRRQLLDRVDTPYG